MGLAFSFDGKKFAMCGQCDEMIKRLFDDPDPEGEIEYSEGNQQVDDSWERFPEVGQALVDAFPDAGDECFCIAVCRAHNIWAVGVNSKGRNRYHSARIALAVALCRQISEAGGECSYADLPTFAPLVEAPQVTPPSLAALPETPPRKKARLPPAEEAAPKRRAPTVNAKVESGQPTLPRDSPFWITLADDQSMPEELAGLAGVAMALSTERKSGYGDGDAVLKYVLGEAAEDVELLDDPDWSKMPEIGEALHQVEEGIAEECYVVAVSRSSGIWAVGVAMTGKARYGAARVALALSCVLAAEAEGEEVRDDLEARFPAFAAHLVEARAAATAYFPQE